MDLILKPLKWLGNMLHLHILSNLQVADLGCADCKLLWMLKFCSCIEVLVGLDISASTMKEKM